jgi:hypothetical protein
MYYSVGIYWVLIILSRTPIVHQISVVIHHPYDDNDDDDDIVMVIFITTTYYVPGLI